MISQSAVYWLLAFHLDRTAPTCIRKGVMRDERCCSQYYWKYVGICCCNGDEEAVHERVQHLKSLYSWQSAAKATMEVYKGS